MRSVWLVHANNARGFVAKTADFGLLPDEDSTIPLSLVTHAAPELLLKVSVSTHVRLLLAL